MSQKNNSVYRSYGFWMSLSAAILLVIQTILSRLGIEIDAPFVQEVISGILAVLVILGVIIKPKTNDDELEDFNMSQPKANDKKLENFALSNPKTNKEHNPKSNNDLEDLTLSSPAAQKYLTNMTIDRD